MGSWKKIILVIFIAALLAGGGFWGWQKIGKNNAGANKISISSLNQSQTQQEPETANAQEIAADSEKAVSAEEENKNSQSEIDNSDNQDTNTKTTNSAANVSTEKKDDATEENSSESSSGKIVQRLVSWGYAASKSRTIDTIIVHSSYDALGSDPYDVSGLLNEYKQYGVAAHYLIDRKGVIYQLVADNNVAYHAGESKVPDGRTGVNNFSIGIELMNTESGSYTSAQYSALNSLIAKLKKNYKIKYVLGHKDIAPGRKTDPWNIDWTKVNK